MAARPLTANSETLRFDNPERAKAVILVAAFLAAFWQLFDFVPPNFGALVNAWVSNPDWSHGPIIPLFSAYLVYQRWDRIRRTPVQAAWVGVPVLVLGLAVYAYGLLVSLFGITRQVGMLITLAGIITTLFGVRIWRHVWVPYLFLLFAIPIPAGIYFQITHPLRELAARVAFATLGLIPGLSIERGDSIIQYTRSGISGTMVVADACSGMRSIMTLCALGVAVAFMSDRPAWQRLILIASCIPIAVLCNFVRVIVTCLIHIYVGPEYASGNYHLLLGLLVLGLALGIFLALGWVLSHLFVESAEDDDNGAPAPPQSQTAS